MTITAQNRIDGSAFPDLMPFQLEKLQSMVDEFLMFNLMAVSHDIEFCPKCGQEKPKFIKGGKSHSGKQLFRCCSCGRRFSSDTGTLTFYSHQDFAKWSSFIKSTLEGKSLVACAEEINVTQKTAFRMRHKLMNFIEGAIPRNKLYDQVEVDEKYFPETHKGLIPEECLEPLADIFTLKDIDEKEDLTIDEQDRVHQKIYSLARHVNCLTYNDKKENKPTRGISHGQVCIMTGIERGGMAEGWATNTAGPTLESAESFLTCVKDESHVWLDGSKAYPQKLEDKQCTYTVVSDETRNHVDHVNNVNSLHNFLAEKNKLARGVNSIYINRYTSMWMYAFNNRSLDKTEQAMKLLGELGKKQQYFYIRELENKRIFDDPYVMEKRKGRISVLSAYTKAKYDSSRREDLYESVKGYAGDDPNYSVIESVELRCGFCD